MGNSGSVHNVATDLDEIGRNHHHYQQHHPFQQHQEHAPLSWTQSYPRDSGPQSQPHIKVLPELSSKAARLRTTTNGAILQSGGTISGRPNLIGPPTQHLQRARTSINYDLSRLRGETAVDDGQQAAANNNLHIVLERSDSREHGPPVIYKRFGSEPDLRGSADEDAKNPRPTKSKLAKTKKKKAAPAPPPCLSQGNQEQPIAVPPMQRIEPKAEPQRKLRLFKTKAESRKLSSVVSSSKLAAEASDQHFRQLNSPERSSARYYSQPTGPQPAPEATKSVQVFPMPVFRREKSFDITLLRNRHQSEIDDAVKTARDRQRPSDVGNILSPELRGPPPPPLAARQWNGELAERPVRKSILETKLRTRKLSQPAPVAAATTAIFDFQKELETVTNRRSLARLENVDRSPQKTFLLSQTIVQPRPSEGPVAKARVAKVEKHESFRNERSPLLSAKARHESKIPQLTKTFYFGMDKTKPDNPASSSHADSFGKIQMEVIDQFAKSILTTQRHHRAGSESSESVLSSEEGFHQNATAAAAGGGTSGSNDDCNDGRIQVHVRPTLPRRQLEIPRFSPAAAWRLLNEDRIVGGGGHFPIGCSDLMGSSATEMTVEPPRPPLEERIQRIYREPIPAYPDNKSGDSGISGDAGLPERPESPRHHFDVKVGPFLTPWTPQQDLEEEDTSSDGGDGDDMTKARRAGSSDDVNKYPSRGHVFSLSLPRESHLSIYGEKDKPGFSSLQKLKRTVSGVFAAANLQSPDRNSLNYRSDNWLLSRSAPNSIDNSQVSPSTGPGNPLDAAIVMQPSSFSYLTGGKHVMYLPNQPIDETDHFGHSLSPLRLTNGKSPDEVIAVPNERESLQDETRLSENKAISATAVKYGGKGAGHRFTFQSTVRQIERRRIADKLSKEAEQKEAQRLSELEAMRRVEEEFQRKRAREKASIRHQLRLFSLEENQCISLPVDWQVSSVGEDLPPPPPHSHLKRAEPDGAVSSPASSPTLPPFNTKSMRHPISDTKAPYIDRIIEQKSARSKTNLSGAITAIVAPDYRQQGPTSTPPPPPPPSTEIRPISRRKYFDYRSSTTKFQPINQQNSQIVRKVPSRSNQLSYHLYEDELDANNSSPSNNFQRDFARRSRSICSSDSDISTPSGGNKHYLSRSDSPSF